MQLIDWVRAQQGVVHTSRLYAVGFSKHQVRAAVSDGVLRRVRRSWILHAECDASRALAAELGGRVTCLSAARLRGLWTPDHDQTHIGVAPDASKLVVPPDARLHWSVGPVPVAPHAVDDAPINLLYQVARCQPEAQALAVWESAVRTGLVELAVLERVRWRSTRARALVDVATAMSDSGMETKFVGMMRGIGIAVRQQVRIDGRPVDGLIGEKLVVQLDGFAHHSSAADRRRDLEADARLRLRGYTVLRFDYQQLFFRPDYVIGVVQAAVAQGLHL